MVNGPASLNASTLQMVEPDITYSLVIDLSISSMYGRVVVKMADRFCTDQAGNLFTRKNNSIVIHFGESSDRDIQKIISFFQMFETVKHIMIKNASRQNFTSYEGQPL